MEIYFEKVYLINNNLRKIRLDSSPVSRAGTTSMLMIAWTSKSNEYCLYVSNFSAL